MKKHFLLPCALGTLCALCVTAAFISCDNMSQDLRDEYEKGAYRPTTDILAKSAVIHKIDGTLEAVLHASANATGDSDTARGNVTYQWQIADSADGEFTDIAAANTKTYDITREQLGKYLRVKFVQKYKGKTYPELTSAVYGPVTNYISRITLTYQYANETSRSIIANGAGDSSNSFNINNVKIAQGSAYNAFGEQIDERTITISSLTDGIPADYYSPSASDYLTVLLNCTGQGITNELSQVFVTVRSAKPESSIPPLRTDVQNIDAGYAAFERDASELEYSLDDGYTYATVDTIPFPAENGQQVLIRKKATGVPGRSGYIKESDIITNPQLSLFRISSLTLGRKVQGSAGISGGFTNVGLTLQSERDATYQSILHLRTAIQNNPLTEGLGNVYDYQWYISGQNALNNPLYTGVTTVTDTDGSAVGLDVDTTLWGEDNYEISCILNVYPSVSAGTSILTLSQQTMIAVKRPVLSLSVEKAGNHVDVNPSLHYYNSADTVTINTNTHVLEYTWLINGTDAFTAERWPGVETNDEFSTLDITTTNWDSGTYTVNCSVKISEKIVDQQTGTVTTGRYITLTAPQQSFTK